MAACGIMKLTRRRKRSSVPMAEPTTPTRKSKRIAHQPEPRIDIYPALVIKSGYYCPPCHFIGINKGWEIEIEATIARGEISFNGSEKIIIKGCWPEVMNTIEESFRLITTTPDEEVSGKFTISIKVTGSDIYLETKGQTRVDVGGNHWCPAYSANTQSFPASGPKGQYQPIAVLGRAGRSGAVWLCYYISKQKFVACKVGLKGQHDIYDEWKAYQDIKSAADKADLKYLLIPKLYAEVDGHDWVVMPLRGDNMEDIWMSGKMEYTKWKAVVIASLRGIKALHSTGTLHDDIKFGNIISSKPAPKTEAFLRAWQLQHYPNAIHKDVVTTPPPLLSPHKGKVGHHIEAYVVDLDGARRLLEQPSAISSNCSHAFRSPEGKLGNALSLASDIWSFGATAFYLLTGLNIKEDDNSQLQFWVQVLGWPNDPNLKEQIEKVIGPSEEKSSVKNDIRSLVTKSMNNQGPVDEVIRLLKCMLCWEPEMRISANACLLLARMLP